MVGTKIKISVVILFVGLLGGCAKDESSEIVDFLTTFDFANGSQSWEGGISDYPIDYNDSALSIDNSINLLSKLPLEGNGLRISADNPHGDLFYFFKREIRDLVPDKKYKIDFEFLVYTKLLSHKDLRSSEELYLKIGATNYEPDLEKITWQNSIEYLVLNVDKGGTNAESGVDIVNVGSVKEFTSETADAISGNTFDHLIEVESDQDGVVWLVIGVDSGIKSHLTFGMSVFTAYFREQD